MTKDEMIRLFKEYRYTDLYKFERIENTIGLRPDFYAFKLLNDCVPGRENIIEEVMDGCIRLSTNCDELAKTMTEETILSLVRCGVECNKPYDRLEIVYEEWIETDDYDEYSDSNIQYDYDDYDGYNIWEWDESHIGG